MPVLNRIASYAEEMKGWRRYLHQHEGDQGDEQQGAGRAENARAEVSVGGTVYGGFPLSGRWFDWCGNERFSQNGQGVRI